MRNITGYSKLIPRTLCLGGMMIAALLSLKAAPERVNDPPVFEQEPADLVLQCGEGIPDPVALTATDDTDPSFPKTIEPQESIDVNDCGGGTIERTWTAIDMDGNISEVRQIITIQPDGQGPVVNLPEVDEVVTCGQDDFSGWLNTIRLQLSISPDVFDECGSGIASIDYSPKYDDPEMGPCETRTVTFIIADGCGNSSEWTASYSTRDNEPPVFQDPPADVTVSCNDPIPPVPQVVVTDNCTTVISPDYEETTTPLPSCPGTSFTIIRTWTAVDDCGNESTIQQQVKVADDEGPTFTVPADIVINCDEDPSNLERTGNVNDLSDNCGGTTDLSFSDVVIDEDCPSGYLIQRTWRAVDDCGNTTIQQQLIEVVDDEAPAFVVPPDITVSCDAVNDPSATGRPTMITDNCDSAPSVRIREETVYRGDAGCANSYEIRRVWRVEDACGNATEKTQTIFVTDESAPQITTPAVDQTLSCGPETNVDLLFEEWLNRAGGALASDNCTLEEDLSWAAYNAGTSDPASLPPAECSGGDQVLLRQTIDFVVTDECGNAKTTTASFTLVDDVAPVIRNCPEEVTIATEAGTCSGLYAFRVPQIAENCSTGSLPQTLTASGTITSDAQSGQEGDVPVNPVVLTFPTDALLPLNSESNASLRLRLVGVDGEEANEFFKIVGEDGSLLGTTEPTDGQCGSSETLVTFSPEQLENWAADGKIEITLEPNLPAGKAGRFAVNAICDPPGQVEGSLEFDRKEFSGLSFAYSIGEGEKVAMDPASLAQIELPQGVNRINLFVTDCGGNTSDCSFFVRVVDLEPPQLTCPGDMTVRTAPDSCSALVRLPLPAALTDNCSAGEQYEQTIPSGEEEALLTFRYDPNLNDYLAENKTYTFTGAAANALGPATLTLDYQGDFSGTGAFLTVLGEDGAAVGRTSLGSADCNTPGQAFFTISRALINEWAADGQVEIRLMVNDIPVPPGQPGDGINPCDAAAVTENGDSDGSSYVYASLSYGTLQPSYYTEGATTTPLNTMEGPQGAPLLEFAAGETTVYYLASDAAGNADTCSFQVNVVDVQAPVARCQPTTVFINPSGIGDETVDPIMIDAGSTDNCTIDTMFLTPNTFSCAEVGSTVQVGLTVRDATGNSGTCTTQVRIESLRPQPAATSGVCGNDTLYLFANPPEANGGIVFTYRWTGPNGFVSDKENPVIPNVDTDNAGSYLVEITGITGCKASGTVEVAIEDLPLTPELIADGNLCVGETLVLNSSVVPSGSGVIYRWYEGVPPQGQLLGVTNLPTFTVEGPLTESVRNFYLTVEADGCVSSASPPATVRISSVPQAAVNEAEITVCEGEAIALGTTVAGPGLQYQWTGPNGFTSASQYPSVIEAAGLANAGVYKLIVSKNGCFSEEALTVVNVLPRPQRPQLSNTGPVCEGGEIVLTTDITRASVYRWISPDLKEFATTSNRFVIPDAGQNDAGSWRVYVSQFGCDSEVSLHSEVVVNNNPPTQASANQDVLCEGDKLQLFAAPAISNAIYRWTGPNGYTAATQNPVIENITKAREGTYQVTINTAEGCSGTASVTVVVQKSAVITAVSNDGPECLDGPTDIHLAASVFPADPGSYRYFWSGPDGYSARDSVAVIRNATEANNGNYQLVVTTAEGCISEPVTTTVAVANPPAAPAVPTVSTDTPAPFCVGENIQLLTASYSGANVVYNWRTPKGVISTSAPALDLPAAAVGDSGEYSVFVTVNGCDSEESGKFLLTVSETPEVTAMNNGPVCESGTIRLNAEVIPGAEYTWTGPGYMSSLPNPEIENARPSQHNGTYSLRVTLNGCTSRLTTTEVRVKPAPLRPVVLDNGPLCISEEGAALELKVDAPSTTEGAAYTWFGPGGEQLEESQEATLRLSDLSAFGNGEFSFTAQATFEGCRSSMSAPAVVRLNTIPESQAFAGDDFRACEGFATNLQATQPTLGSGRWTLIGEDTEGVSIANPDQAMTAVSGMEGGRNYTFRWTLSNGACLDYSADETVVTVTESEVVDAGEDIITCASEEVTLGAFPVMTNQATWSQTDVQELLGVEIVDPTDPGTLVTGLEPGNLYSFKWTVNGGCGEITDEVFVLISDPNPFAGLDKIACNDDGFAFMEADEPTEGSRGKWNALTPSVTFSDPRNPQTMAMGLQPGENVFIWTVDEGICGDDSRDTVVIDYKENPLANPDEVEVPFGKTVEFDLLANDSVPPNSYVNIIGMPEKGFVEATGEGTYSYRSNANLVGEETMTYELCSEACECSLTTVTFVVGADAQCEVPNIFTPNNDGINDTFVIPCLLDADAYPQSRITVFNRWGDEVYRSPSPYRNDWRGTFNGEALPAGTYFYLIELGNDQQPMDGFIVIQR